MYNPFSLQGKNILVTGASSGIGKACCIAFSKLGANLILIGRNQGNLNETKKALTPGNHFCCNADLAKTSDIKEYLNTIHKSAKTINGFVHAAGVESTKPLKSLKIEDFNSMLNVNYLAGFEILKHLAHRKFRDKSEMSIVFIASVMGITGSSGKIAYSGSKGAVIASVKSAALELASRQIRVNAISPAMIQTDMTQAMLNNLPCEKQKEIEAAHPLGYGNVNDIANACIFLLSGASKWVTGSNLIVDGGYSAL